LAKNLIAEQITALEEKANVKFRLGEKLIINGWLEIDRMHRIENKAERTLAQFGISRSDKIFQVI